MDTPSGATGTMAPSASAKKWQDVEVVAIDLPWGGGTTPTQFKLAIVTQEYRGDNTEDGDVETREIIVLQCDACISIFGEDKEPRFIDTLTAFREAADHMSACGRNKVRPELNPNRRIW